MPSNRIRSLIIYAILIFIFIFTYRWVEFANKQQFDLMKPIVEGVIGGVVTSLLILMFGILWKNNLTPWIENLLYRDAKIEGIWRGILVPFIGVEQLDKIRMHAAWQEFEQNKNAKSNRAKTNSKIPTEASENAVDKPARPIDAELLLPETTNFNGTTKDTSDSKKRTVKIEISVEPIEIRVELSRIGHNISGNVVEIGGASQIHTYSLCGSFRNLILSGQYENLGEHNIDRGSFSLMLKSNGGALEGFFASYADHDNHIQPFRCILKRQGVVASNKSA